MGDVKSILILLALALSSPVIAESGTKQVRMSDIAGIHIEPWIDLVRVQALLGPAGKVNAGDASSSVEKVCYRFDNGTLSFGNGELDGAASISDGKWKGESFFMPDLPDLVVSGDCAEKKGAVPAFNNGMRLGLPRTKVMELFRYAKKVKDRRDGLGNQWATQNGVWSKVPKGKEEDRRDVMGFEWVQKIHKNSETEDTSFRVAVYFVNGLCSRIDLIVGD